MKYRLFRNFIFVILGAIIAILVLMRSLDFQTFLLKQYASKGGGRWNVGNVIDYLSVMPFKESRVYFRTSEDAPAKEVTMLDALLLYVATDVSMTEEDQSLLRKWIYKYHMHPD